MINLLIVSKDRPCQLDLLLRSIIKKFLVPYQPTILYTYSSDFYKLGYDIILDLYKEEFNFVKETNFKQDVLNTLNQDNKYFTVVPDDIIFYNCLSLTAEFEIFDNNSLITALNYRMGPNLEIIFQGCEPEAQPEFTDQHIWDWQKCKSRNWHYPMGMCQIHRTADMIDYLPIIAFDSPTMLEGLMVVNPFKDKPLMICFEDSKIIELAVNRVQQISTTNAHGIIDVHTLNKTWLSGKCIKLEPLYNLPKNINRFYYIDFEYEDILF